MGLKSGDEFDVGGIEVRPPDPGSNFLPLVLLDDWGVNNPEALEDWFEIWFWPLEEDVKLRDLRTPGQNFHVKKTQFCTNEVFCWRQRSGDLSTFQPFEKEHFPTTWFSSHKSTPWLLVGSAIVSGLAT